MKRWVRYVLAGLAMFGVAFLAGAIALRLAIHGREVTVPNLQGKSDADAAAAAKDLGLNVSVENRFYSPIAANHVLSQSPAAGSLVRRGWQVRVTESLGGQKVAVPDVTGQTERLATLSLRRQALEVGAEVRLPAPGPAGVVLGQSPPPNSVGLNGPKVALVVSDDESAGAQVAYVMPQIVGMTLGAAGARLATVGLRIASAQQPQAAVVGDATAAPAAGETAPNVDGLVVGDPIPAAVPVIPAIVSLSQMIVSQAPAAGRKVTRADAIRVTLAE